jgi:hypothetical protein
LSQDFCLRCSQKFVGLRRASAGLKFFVYNRHFSQNRNHHCVASHWWLYWVLLQRFPRMMMDSSMPPEGEGPDHDSSLHQSERSTTKSIIPIEMEDTSASFPAAEEIRGDIAYSAKKNRNRRSWIKRGSMLFLVLLFVLIIVIATTVPLAKRSSKRSAASRASTATTVVDYMATEGVAMDNLKKEGTPQERAARWLAEEDPANIPVPTADTAEHEKFRYLARYDEMMISVSVLLLVCGVYCFWLTRCAVIVVVMHWWPFFLVAVIVPQIRHGAVLLQSGRRQLAPEEFYDWRRYLLLAPSIPLYGYLLYKVLRRSENDARVSILERQQLEWSYSVRDWSFVRTSHDQSATQRTHWSDSDQSVRS